MARYLEATRTTLSPILASNQAKEVFPHLRQVGRDLEALDIVTELFPRQNLNDPEKLKYDKQLADATYTQFRPQAQTVLESLGIADIPEQLVDEAAHIWVRSKSFLHAAHVPDEVEDTALSLIVASEVYEAMGNNATTRIDLLRQHDQPLEATSLGGDLLEIQRVAGLNRDTALILLVKTLTASPTLRRTSTSLLAEPILEMVGLDQFLIDQLAQLPQDLSTLNAASIKALSTYVQPEYFGLIQAAHNGKIADLEQIVESMVPLESKFEVPAATIATLLRPDDIQRGFTRTRALDVFGEQESEVDSLVVQAHQYYIEHPNSLITLLLERVQRYLTEANTPEVTRNVINQQLQPLLERVFFRLDNAGLTNLQIMPIANAILHMELRQGIEESLGIVQGSLEAEQETLDTLPTQGKAAYKQYITQRLSGINDALDMASILADRAHSFTLIYEAFRHVFNENEYNRFVAQLVSQRAGLMLGEQLGWAEEQAIEHLSVGNNDVFCGIEVNDAGELFIQIFNVADNNMRLKRIIPEQEARQMRGDLLVAA